jgi:hypothetical protein
VLSAVRCRPTAQAHIVQNKTLPHISPPTQRNPDRTSPPPLSPRRPPHLRSLLFRPTLIHPLPLATAPERAPPHETRGGERRVSNEDQTVALAAPCRGKSPCRYSSRTPNLILLFPWFSLTEILFLGRAARGSRLDERTSGPFWPSPPPTPSTSVAVTLRGLQFSGMVIYCCRSECV